MSENNFFKHENLTVSHEYHDADTEFVFSYRGQPFATTISSFCQSPTTLIDFSLVRDLKMKMTDLKCQRFSFGGQKTMRILGKVSTYVQYVKDGTPMGQCQFTATVVRGLTQSLDVDSIAGAKLVSKLTGTEAGKEESPKQQKKKAKTSPKKNAAERKCEDTPATAAPSVPAVVPGVQPAATAPSVPAAVPGVTPVNRPEVSRVDQSPPLRTPPKLQRPQQPTSPPGFPTPKFPRPNIGCVLSSPPRLRARDQQLKLSPLSSNIRLLDDEFWGADVKPYYEEMDTLETNGYQDTRYYHCQLDEFSNTEFAFTKVTAMEEAYDYWSGHGRNKCSPECLNLQGQLPNNCGYHPQFKFPARFRMCSERCRGAFCVCLRSYK